MRLIDQHIRALRSRRLRARIADIDADARDLVYLRDVGIPTAFRRMAIEKHLAQEALAAIDQSSAPTPARTPA